MLKKIFNQRGIMLAIFMLLFPSFSNAFHFKILSLNFMIKKGVSVQKIQVKIEEGADVNKRDLLTHYTPLMNAIKYNRPEVVELLLQAGADIDARDEDERTTLMFFAAQTVKQDELDAVRLLIQAGADVNARGRFGETALGLALDKFHQAVPLLKSKRMILILENAGAVE